MRATCLVCLAAIAITGCHENATTLSEVKTEATQVAATIAEPSLAPAIDLDPAALQELKTWDETSKALAVLTDRLCDIVDEVSDADSAKQAIPKLQDISKGFRAISEAEDKMGEPTIEQQGLVLRNLSKANSRFGASYSKLSENEELFKLVGNAVDQAYVGDPVEAK